MMRHIADKIQEADLVLVGLGEELDLLKTIRRSDDFQKIAEQTENVLLLPFVEKLLIEDRKAEKIKNYQMLAKILEKKNYFVVSLCQDGIIRQAGLKEERIVEPCGNYNKLQCSEICCTDLFELPEAFMEEIRMLLKGEKKEKEIQMPVCPKCGKALVWNHIDSEKYLEEGYLQQWKRYKMWLQGTVNRNLCILEIGVGMKYPTVIRWPFEKITFLNQKAELFRVHSRLYQMTEELKDKGIGICQEPEEFIRELSNNFSCAKLKSACSDERE